jgi:hypothetical protein
MKIVTNILAWSNGILDTVVRNVDIQCGAKGRNHIQSVALNVILMKVPHQELYLINASFQY